MSTKPLHRIEGVEPERLPRHVAVIMDGNGRWADERALPRHEGHREGAKAVREVVTRSRELGLGTLTLYAFSAQNWARPEDEVHHLMSLLVEFCHSELKLMLDNGIRLSVIGQRDRIPGFAREAIEMVEERTRELSDMQLVIAVSYGAREEIVQAVRAIARDVEAGQLAPDAIEERDISSRLWTSAFPDPDLVIRTSGELRVSNFLLWQIAYSELYVDECLWPDFDRERFDEALTSFARRERRYGNIGPAEE